MRYTVYYLSDTGRVRQLNEDSVRVERPSDPAVSGKWGDLYVVADGMGGHDSGEVASNIAIETVAQAYYSAIGMPTDAALAGAIEQANAEIFRRAQEEDRLGMGTTVVAAVRIENKLFIAHVGDSRMYLIRNGQIKPLTQDHSMVAEQVAAGLLTPEEAERHPYRNVISRAVGTTPQVEVEISPLSPLELREGDVVILCSDGLTEHVKPPQMRQIVANRAPEPAAHALIKAANQGGGSDNISVIVLRAGEPKSDTNTTAVMPVGDAITEPTPVIDLASPEETRARLAGAAAPPPIKKGGMGCVKLLAAGLVGALVFAGGYLFFNPSLLFPAPIGTTTPVVITATVPQATVSTAPMPTNSATPPPSATTVPLTTEPVEPTLAPLPTLPPPVAE